MYYVSDFWTKIQTYFQEYPIWVPEAVTGAFIGICVGFLSRVFGRYIIFSALTLALFGALMQNAGLVTFHFDGLAGLLGVDELPSTATFLGGVLIWIKEHLAAFAFSVLAFIIGWRMGG